MPILLRLPALFAVLLIGTAGIAAESTGQELADGEIRDHDYAFKLRSPGGGWKLLAEEQIGRFTPDAAAGIVKLARQSIWGAVIVERAPGADVGGLADLLIESMPLERSQVLERERLTFDGHPAVRFVIEGEIDGVRARFANLVFNRDGWVYQVLAWGLAAEIRSNDPLFAVHGLFGLLEGPPRARAAVQTVQEAGGPGWRLAGGVFESAPYRLRATAGRGWRLLVGEELDGANPAAEIGLYHAEAETYIVVIPEVLPIDDRAEFVSYVRSTFADALGSRPHGDRVLEVDGRPRRFDRYRSDEGIEFEYLHAVWIDGRICYQLLAWYPAGMAPQAAAALHGGLANVDVLGEGRAAELQRELAGLADTRDAIGPDHALRGGVYRNFELEFEWRRPERGVWELLVGQQARADTPDALLVFEEKTTGIYGSIDVEPAAGRSTAEHHARAAGDFAAFLGLSAAPLPRTLRMGTAEGRFTAFPPDPQDPLALGYRLASLVHRGRAITVRVHGGAANLAGGMAELAARALAPLAAQVGARTLDDGVYRDWRVGFGLRLPAGLTRPQDMTPEPLAPAGSLLTLPYGDDQGMTVIGISSLTQQVDGAFFMELIEPVLRQHLGGQALPDAPAYETELAGRPATGRRFKADRLIDVVFTVRGVTLYGVIAVAKDETTLTRMRDSFFLLD